MPRLEGSAAERLESLGVRVRLVTALGEGVIYFRKRALALVDQDLVSEERDDALDWVIDQLLSRRDAGEGIVQ